MRFVLFVIDDKSNSGTPQEITAIDAFNQKLELGHNLEIAVGIADPDKASLIDNRQDFDYKTSGSLNGSSFYSGFWIFHAESEGQAIELSREASKACNRKVELRPILGN